MLRLIVYYTYITVYCDVHQQQLQQRLEVQQTYVITLAIQHCMRHVAAAV
jgi:hypothetical protein